MRTRRSLLVLCFVVNLAVSIQAQQLMSIKPKDTIICYQGFENKPDHVHPPEAFRKGKDNPEARLKTSNFEVEFVGLPSEAQTAFQYAIDIWETQLASSVPIHVRANWSALEPGVLGEAIWGTAFANFHGAQYLNTFYPVALAEKIAQKEMNPGQPDIVATFNSNTNWYFGTDGNTPAGKIDFVTVVLHEIGHGLGFTMSYDKEGDEGSVGLLAGGNRVPLIYDLFVENSEEKNLYFDFESPSAPLGMQLTSDNLHYRSPLARNSNGDVFPKLYAPASFSAGSSIAHLDENTFNGQGDANKLMTPHIHFMEAIHDPGPIVTGIFSDMGWITTRIVHEDIKDSEQMNGTPIQVKANIVSDNGYDPQQVVLHYTTDGVNFQQVSMQAVGIDEFEGFLPGTINQRTYGYYISAVDVLGRTFTYPGKFVQEANQPALQALVIFSVGPDNEKPEITHTPVTQVKHNDATLNLSAVVTDNVGIDEVVIEWKFNDTPQSAVTMTKSQTEEDTYEAEINLPVGLVSGDKLEYRIVATDNALVGNQKADPETGFHLVLVTGPKPVQDFYLNDFNQPTADFVLNNFSITTPQGFQNGALHSTHPYPNGAGLGVLSNYTAELQVPIRLNNVNPVIEFDEIVLVEPGESGSFFGDPGFWDYVIVEGSADEGTTWIPIGKGYDSGDKTIWLDRWNSSLDSDESSTATGAPSLFQKRSLNMLEGTGFSAGDEIMIRFRLYADAFVNGWGWAIDNLSIQSPLTGISSILESGISVYPVPAHNRITVEWNADEYGALLLEITNLRGKTVYYETADSQSGLASKEIGIADLPPGVYLLNARSANGSVMKKIIKH